MKKISVKATLFIVKVLTAFYKVQVISSFAEKGSPENDIPGEKMTTDQLKKFLMVAKYKNFTKAAEQLYIGQPTLSRQIENLEKQFNTTLFVRNNRSVSLTPAGEILQAEAQKLIDRLDYIQMCMEYANKGQTGILKLAVLSPISPEVTRASKKTIESMPQVDFQITYQEQRELLERLIAGEIDIGIAFGFSIKYSPELSATKIAVGSFCLVIPKDDPLASEEKITSDMIHDKKMIVLKEESQPSFLNKILDVDHIIKGTNITYAPNIYSMLLYADMGIGIGIIPRFVTGNTKEYSVVIRDIEDLDTREDIVITWNKDNQNPAVAEFVNTFLENLGS